MFLKVQLKWHVIISPESLVAEGLLVQKAIMVRLLADFASKKATDEFGYYMAVTSLDSIGEGKVRQSTGEVLFPVDFSAITFKLFKGEILKGVVKKVLKHGVFLDCGPVQNIYLSYLKMPGYKYLPGENASFIHDDHPNIEKEVVIRFVVLGTKWMEAERAFQALASLEGDYLGPVSS